MSKTPPSYLEPRQREFIKLLDEAARIEASRRGDVFKVWLEMGYQAMRKATVPFPQQDAVEALYMKAVNGMHDKHKTCPIMVNCFAILQMALTEECHDFLGPIFMETISDAGKGQFFTPDPLAYMMGKITCSQIKQVPGEWLTMAEPAAGTGTIVFATCRALKDANIHYQKAVRWTLTELDRHAYRGLYIQCALLGLDAVVVNGNTLTLEEFESAVTPVHMLQRWMPPYLPKPAPRDRTRPVQTAPRERTRTYV